MNALNAMAHACQVLGSSHHASKTEITKAYKELARKHHPDKSPSNQERAAEEFKQIKNAYDILLEANAEDEPTESRNAEQSATSASNAEDWRQPEQSATSASNAADWLLPDSMPTFEVAYKRQKWCDVNEDISREMYTAYLANTPGYYREPVTGNGKGGNRRYMVDWDQMLQTNVGNGRQRSVRFRGLQQDEHRLILTGEMRKRPWSQTNAE